MRKRDLDSLRTQLLASRDQLHGELQQVHDDGLRVAEDDFDGTDEVDRAMHLDSKAEHESHQIRVRTLLEDTDRVLALMDADGYGACADCGQDIPIERLRAIPRSTHCVPCASKRRATA